jgi:hypothetical protein
MGPIARTVGGVSVVLAPALLAMSDHLRMAVEPATSLGGLEAAPTVETVLADLSAVEAARGTYLASAWTSYAALLLMIPALVAIWRLSVRRSPRWAWAGATMAALGVVGVAVHMYGYFGQSLAALEVTDRAAAADLILTGDGVPIVIALFVPYFLAFLCVLPQAVGLFRAGVIPLWACLALGAGTVLFLLLGSTPVTTTAWALLLVAGFAPAALAMLRGSAPARIESSRAGVVTPA